MTTTLRHQVQVGRRRRRLTIPEDCIFVGRGTIFENPFDLNIYSRQESLDNYHRSIIGTLTNEHIKEHDPRGEKLGSYLWRGERIRARLPALAGRPLSTKEPLSQASHVDILIKLANQTSPPTNKNAKS